MTTLPARTAQSFPVCSEAGRTRESVRRLWRRKQSLYPARNRTTTLDRPACGIVTIPTELQKLNRNWRKLRADNNNELGRTARTNRKVETKRKGGGKKVYKELGRMWGGNGGRERSANIKVNEKYSQWKQGKKLCIKDNGNENVMKVVEEREGKIWAVIMKWNKGRCAGKRRRSGVQKE